MVIFIDIYLQKNELLRKDCRSQQDKAGKRGLD